MANKLSENAVTILKFLQDNTGDYDYTEIAEKVNLAPKTVSGCITSALQKRGLAERVEVEGKEKKVIRLTVEGLSFDPDAEVVAEA